MTPKLVAEDVRYSYKRGFTLSLDRLTLGCGSVTTLVGPSGSGKSTLLAVLSGALVPQRGAVSIDGHRVQPSQLNRLVCLALQGAPLWKGTVEDNLRMALKFAGVPSGEHASRVSEALVLTGAESLRTSGVKTLSGGEAQRAALARTAAVRPRVLLLDEPLAHIDEPSREQLALDLKQFFTSKGATVLWVTHDRDEALSIGEQVAVIEDGRLLQQGPPAELIERPADERVARFLGTDNILNAKIEQSKDGIASVITEEGAVLDVVTDLAPGTDVLVLIRSEDIGLWTEEPGRSSPRNRFRVTVQEILQMGATVKVRTRGGPGLSALITRPTFQELQIHSDQTVWLVFKASSARVLRAAPGDVSWSSRPEEA